MSSLKKVSYFMGMVDDVILHPEIFAELNPGDLIQIWDPDFPSNKLIVKVPIKSSKPSLSRIEISVLKALSDSAGFKQFGKVLVVPVTEEEASLDFVELSFRKQYLQRGNMLRFKTNFIGRTVYMNQNLNIDSVQAQIQDLRMGGMNSQKSISGLVTDSTKFVFRSKSARVIWLVQISAEMWDFDMTGDLYFEKFLQEFVSPVFDSWKALGVSHMLTIIFFARTFYLDRVSQKTHPDLYAKRSFGKNSSGFYQQDHFQIVIENVADYDKVSQIKLLRQQFWEFAARVNWRACKDPEKEFTSRLTVGTTATAEDSEESKSVGKASNKASLLYAVPSDAVHGNVLEAINATLNILEKHYMDRDLSRTGNSIVLVSVGPGVFKVKPTLAQITKQRMLDSAFGIDFISLSRPPVHVVPLFLVDCKAEGVGMTDFYEMPHWIRVSYVDCKNKQTGNDQCDDEHTWNTLFAPPPVSTGITANIMHADDLRSLVTGYVNALPQALRQYISVDPLSDELEPLTSATVRVDSKLERVLSRTSSLGSLNANTVPQWGHASTPTSANKRSVDGFSSKSTFYQRDLLNVKAVAMSRSPLFNKKLYTEIFESLPAMRHERDNMVAESYTSDEEAGSKSLDQGSFDSYMQQHEGHLHSMNEKSMVALNKLPVNKQKLLDSTYLIKKLRDEAFLSDITSSDQLEELFFKHDAALFKVSVNQENVQENKPQPAASTSNAASSTSSINNSRQNSSKAILMPSSDSAKREREDSGKGSSGRQGIAELNSPVPAGSPNVKPAVSMPTADASPNNQKPLDVAAGQARGPMSNRDLWLRNRHQQQLAQRNLETKKALMNASKPNAAAGGAVAKKGVTTLEYLQEYCKSYGINPFKQKEGKKYLSQMSHNRRRWSHVFPLGKTMSDLGLNWKSLTQPAILPLNTDYLPSVVDLKDRFEVSTYTIQFMASDSPFNTLEDALKELVCQRLTHEFQLVEGRDQLPYMRLNNKYTLGSQQNFFILTMGHRIQFLYGDSATSEISISQYTSKKGKNSDFKPESKEGDDKTSFTYRYEMWMPQLQRFDTIVQSFHQFPTPELKWNLVDNVIVGGDSFDGSLDNVKTRRLRYMVIPHNISTTKDIEAYYEQIEMLLDYFRKNLTKDAKIEVTKDTSFTVNDFCQLEKAFGCVTLNRFSSVYRQCQRGYSTARLYMRGPKHANPNWIFFKYERNLYSCKAFHFEMHWTVCDSWLIDEYLNLLFRRCSKWGLRVVQTPEYFTTSNLSIHPFKALPYIQLPEAIHRVPNSHSSALRVVERLVFGRSQGWIFDSEQTTDWSNIGLAPPNYVDRDRDFAFELESSSSTDSATPNSNYVVPTPSQGVFSALTRTLRMVFKKSDDDVGAMHFSADSPSPDIYPTTASSSSPALGGNSLFGLKNSNTKLDRQYVHVSGLAVVRMAANGFIWFHNATARVTEGLPPTTLTPTSTPADFSSHCFFRCENSVVVPASGTVRPLLTLQGANTQAASVDERRTQTLVMMRSLERYISMILDCHEIVLDMVTMSISACEDKASVADSFNSAKESGADSINSAKAGLIASVISAKEDGDIPPAPLSNRSFSSETVSAAAPPPTLLLPSLSSQNLLPPEGISPRKANERSTSDRQRSHF